MILSPADPRPGSPDGLDVQPFRALTYRQTDPAALARVSSPAYDLVSDAGRDRLADADPYNIVRLILPRVEEGPQPRTGRAAPDPTAGAVRAEQAGRVLRDWEAAGVLVRCPYPALWRYELDCPTEGRTVGWLGSVGLPPEGSRAILPHEDVRAGAVDGRRQLLAATRTDLEPIVLAHDADGGLAELTRDAGKSPATLDVTDADGVRHRLWEVTEPRTVAALQDALSGVGAVIADGHHRFAAAQAHRASGATGSGRILSLLTPMGDGGLRVRAIHRVLPGLPLDAAVAAAAGGFRVTELPLDGDLLRMVAHWSAQGSRTPGFLLTDGRRLVELSEPTPRVLGAAPWNAPSAWRELDVVLAHHGLIGELWHLADDGVSVLVAHDPAEAFAAASTSGGTALLLRSPSPADVAAVARAGARMPRKSTLFVPKPRTGLVMRPHEG